MLVSYFPMDFNITLEITSDLLSAPFGFKLFFVSLFMCNDTLN